MLLVNQNGNPTNLNKIVAFDEDRSFNLTADGLKMKIVGTPDHTINVTPKISFMEQ